MHSILLLLPTLAFAAKTYGTCGTQLKITAGGYGKPTLHTFDLSGITGEAVTYTYTDPNADMPTTFYFTPCGDTSQTCDDPIKTPAVGMGVRQTEDAGGNKCDVLGSFSTDDAVWSPLLEDDTGDFIGLQLKGGEGSACLAGGAVGSSYSLITNFNCYEGNPKDRVKATPAATAYIASNGEGCYPVYQINTCEACADGCQLPLTPTGSNNDGGIGWFAWLLIICFLILLPGYLIGGYVVYKRPLPPFDRCLTQRTLQEPGEYSAAASMNGGTTYGSVSDSL